MAMDWEPTSYGSPVNGIYKLVEIDGIPVMKQSSGKLTILVESRFFAAFKERRLKQTDWD